MERLQRYNDIPSLIEDIVHNDGTWPSDEIMQNFTIGNSKFSDDWWDLSPLYPNKAKRLSKLNFSVITDSEMKLEIKKFTFLQTVAQRSKITTIIRGHVCILEFIRVIKQEYPFIKTFEQVTSLIFQTYIQYLHNKNVGNQGKSDYCSWLKRLFTAEPDLGLKIPKNAIWHWNVKDEFPYVKTQKCREIPIYILKKLISTALKIEPGGNLKLLHAIALIIILSQTGGRISEVLNLKKGCIGWDVDGSPHVVGGVFKSSPEVDSHKIPTNVWVSDVIARLEKINAENNATVQEGEYLFLEPHHSSPTGWRILTDDKARKRLKSYCKKYNITDDSGKVVNVTPHQFRHSFVGYLSDQGLNEEVISKFCAHVGLKMTSVYRDKTLKRQAEMLDKLLEKEEGLIGPRVDELREINQKIIEKCVEIGDAEFTPEFKLRWKNKQAYHDMWNRMKQLYNIKFLASGFCVHTASDPPCETGSNCIQVNCPNYGTYPEFLPLHKEVLQQIESQMTEAKEKGWVRQYEHLQGQYKARKKIVDQLEKKLWEVSKNA